MTESIDQRDYLMLLALEANPIMSMRSLAKEVNLSWTTVKNRFNNIVSKGILRPPLAKPETEKLGLRRLSFNTKIPNYQALKQVERILNEQPYITYRARSVGESVGIFIQFDLPVNEIAESNLRLFFDKLISRNLIDDYCNFPSRGIRYEVYPDLTKFNISTASWDYSWDNWFTDLSNKEEGELPLPQPSETNFRDFTPLQFDIIHVLSKDGTTKQAELAKQFDLSKTEAHRQYTNVMKNYIKSLRLNYNRDYFDLTETYIFTISELSIKDQAILLSHLRENPPPFRFAIDVLEDSQVMLWGNMSTSQSNEFIMQLWKKYPNIRISRLDTRDNGAMTYYFWPPNFDFETMNWKVSQEYMVDLPISHHD